MPSVLMLGARQSIQYNAREVLGQATCIQCSVLSGARALNAAGCSLLAQMISAHQIQRRRGGKAGGGGAQVLGQALSTWGISKQPNA
jgi:hypothetical protein